ncbi:glyoxalase superfamily protein [Guptibacillus hwajinpoensis]|uniref:glyoxalase superfamily protein n=1 Tax=Guptibacillus hwajinpoensis TaxID=208199 RepID=UPI003D074007
MITPIFRIFDTEKATDFYRDFLGFNVDWRHRHEENMPEYIQVSFHDALIHLTEHHGDASPGSSIRVKLNNVEDYHHALTQKEYAYANPGMKHTPWKTIEMTVTDPFLNRITFYEEK